VRGFARVHVHVENGERLERLSSALRVSACWCERQQTRRNSGDAYQVSHDASQM
jgi:hypothetical protein